MLLSSYREEEEKKEEHSRSDSMMLPTLIDRSLVRLFDSSKRERDQETNAKRGRMHVSINHDLNHISTSARAPPDRMEK
jgi:hypothetical protein